MPSSFNKCWSLARDYSESSYFQLYELADHQNGAQKAIEIIEKSSNINQELQSIRDELITKYDSSMRSIDYWNMLQEMVK